MCLQTDIITLVYGVQLLHATLLFNLIWCLACVCILGQHFKQFYCSQLKNGQLDEMSAKVSEM